VNKRFEGNCLMWRMKRLFFLVKIISQVNGEMEKVSEERLKVTDSDEDIFPVVVRMSFLMFY